ncbi:delta(7)-sterol 5(6)-desaturase erg32-like [Branchiostoma floridae]|nr:delta(7)-sterol 5(6)-desaturase erg32-like [Branchiostoma floridae]
MIATKTKKAPTEGAPVFFIMLRNMLIGLVSTVATTLMGAAAKGDWLIMLVYLRGKDGPDKALPSFLAPSGNGTAEHTVFDQFLESHGMKHLHLFILMGIAGSFIIYYPVGGFWHWYYYVRQRDQAEEWKCQPNKFLSKENEAHAVMLGSFNMVLGGTLSGTIACYIVNGGYSMLYFNLWDYGIVYTVLSTMFVFLLNEWTVYWSHRIMHMPVLYKKIHKWHHRYIQPTAFTASAMHPCEFLLNQCIMAAPMFIFPLHVGSYVGVLLWTYYYGMRDHSGIISESPWPWQQDVMFHDDHHLYFHVNFGMNTKFIDMMYGTVRRKDREYSEDIFYGFGREKAENKAQ